MTDSPTAPPERTPGTPSDADARAALAAVRTEVAKVARDIQRDTMPSFDGPLHPVE